MSLFSNLNAAHILVAESIPDEMDRTTGILEDAGYNIQKAYFIGDALFALEQSRFDLAVIDAHMAGPDHKLLVDQMAQFAPVVWIALAQDENVVLNTLLGKGASGYVQRPVTPEALLRQVQNALGTPFQAAPAAPLDRDRRDFSQLLERRLIEQQTLSALARSLSAVLDLDSLLTQVVEAAVKLCNAEEGLLLLPDEDEQTLYVRAVKGIDSETARHFRIKTQDSLAGHVFHSGKPVLVGDQGWQKVKTEYLVKSLLYVPLSLKGDTLGVLGVNNRQSDRTFSPHDIDLLQDLAAHAAIAIENARLYRELELSLDELRRTQSKLVQTARLSAMGELAAAVAHQINNPLTTILGDTELLLKDLPVDDPNREAVEAISRAGKRAHEVVRRLLGMARQQAPEEFFEPLDINQTIQNTLTLVRGHIQQGNVALSVVLEEGMPPINAIRGQLEDAWLNLLLNARDAVEDCPSPRIGVITNYHRSDQLIEVIVWDNGVGIPEEQQKQIFEPFFTTKPAGEGTGLGLHICRQIIRKCKGSLSVQSAYNEGTRFIIHLPVYQKRDVP